MIKFKTIEIGEEKGVEVDICSIPQEDFTFITFPNIGELAIAHVNDEDNNCHLIIKSKTLDCAIQGIIGSKPKNIVTTTINFLSAIESKRRSEQTAPSKVKAENYDIINFPIVGDIKIGHIIDEGGIVHLFVESLEVPSPIIKIPVKNDPVKIMAATSKLLIYLQKQIDARC